MELHDICEALKICYERRWISTRDGNVSIRDNDILYITPSGVRKQDLTPQQFTKFTFQSMIQLNNNKPSGELPMHSKLQPLIGEKTVILHLHPVNVLACLYRGLDLQSISSDFPELNCYTKVGKTIPICPPVSQELANLVAEEYIRSSFDIVAIDRHGIVAIGKDIWEAFEHVERLNHACEIVLLANK